MAIAATFTTPLAFLVNTLFGLYTLAVILRFLLQKVRADYNNPISQLVIRVTNPVLSPLHRLIPGWRGYDLAAVLVMFILQAINVTLLSAIYTASYPEMGYPGALELPLYALLKLVVLFIGLFIFTILIQVVVSWLNPQGHNPALTVLWQLNRPLLEPIRRVVPRPGGLDLTPMAAIIGLFFLFLLVQGLLPPFLVRM